MTGNSITFNGRLDLRGRQRHLRHEHGAQGPVFNDERPVTVDAVLSGTGD